MRVARAAFVGVSAGLTGTATWALGRGLPGLPAVGACVLGWFAFATVGVCFPRLQMYAPVTTRGPAGRRRVALTFDDGPHPRTTRAVLAALAATRHRATFFVLGEKARRHPEVVRDIHAAGHVVGLHGDVHDRLHAFRLPARVRAEIERASRAVTTAGAPRPRFFRPPLGHTSATTAYGARLAGVSLVGWSARGYDGVAACRPEAVLERLERTIDDGAIVLLHDAAERDDFEPASIRALPRMLTLLDARGLTSVGLDVLLRDPTPAGRPPA